MTRIFTPRPWQPGAIRHLLDNLRCALFVPPGMGKTSMVLRALEILNLIEPVYPALVLAPLRVARDTWRDETQKWTFSKHLRVSPILGDKESRLAALKRPAEIYTCNYENIPWLVELYGKRWPFKTIIADEESRLKSFRPRQGGARAKALYKVAWPYCKRFWGLTGSPASNGLVDLFGPMYFLDQGERLGRTFTSFEQRWFTRVWNGFSIEPQAHAHDEIMEKIKDLCLSVDPADWMDIKVPVTSIIYVDLPPVARKLYDDMEREMFVTIEEEGIEAFNAAAKRNKLVQMCNGAVYLEDGKTFKVTHDEKIQALESLVEEAAGMPVLVAYHYKSDLARLQKAFPHAVNLATAEGLAKFKTGKFAVGFAHPASLGHGIDGLQEVTNILVYFAHSDNLENHQQILERIGPMRQMQSELDRPVFVYSIVARNTIEEWAVLPNLQGKGRLQDLIMKAMKR